MKRLSVLCVVFLTACGAPPTAPSIVEFRESNIGLGPMFIIDFCIIPAYCSVTRRIQNVGNSCATDVHATITPLDPGGNVLATYGWALTPNIIVRPLQPVEIRLEEVPYAIVQAAARWRISPGWRQTACPT